VIYCTAQYTEQHALLQAMFRLHFNLLHGSTIVNVLLLGVRGSAMVKAPPTSRKVTGSRPNEVNEGPGLYSASNRNEYQKHANNVSWE
jgi:hypothetical protein